MVSEDCPQCGGLGWIPNGIESSDHETCTNEAHEIHGATGSLPTAPQTVAVTEDLDTAEDKSVAPVLENEENVYRAFIQKWAGHFARNGTGYMEHQKKDEEAVTELQALIATSNRQATQAAADARFETAIKGALSPHIEADIRSRYYTKPEVR